MAFSDGVHVSHVSSPSSRAALDSIYDAIVLCVPASLETAALRTTLPDALTALLVALGAAETAPRRVSMAGSRRRQEALFSVGALSAAFLGTNLRFLVNIW
eukprot:scaffold109745_cov66-Phaeocystis_antarctica.AAC.4